MFVKRRGRWGEKGKRRRRKEGFLKNEKMKKNKIKKKNNKNKIVGHK